MAQLEFDENTAKQLEAMYGSRDVLRRRALVRSALGALPGDRIIDIGCGPGFYVAELLEEVRPHGSVVGIDGSDPMLAIARRRCAGHENVSFHQADATSLPVEDGEADGGVSVQVLEYVPDIPAALAEVHRALRPGGRLVVWDVDWGTWSSSSSDPELTERIQRLWDRHLTHPSLPRTLTAQLRSAGFEDVEMEGHLFATNLLDPERYGGMAISMMDKGFDQLLPTRARSVATTWTVGSLTNARWANAASSTSQSLSSASPPDGRADLPG